MDEFCSKLRIRWATGQSPEIYTVYSDGSGVEAYRCDHGARRQAGKQAASGDIVFASEHGMGRFTSAAGTQVELKAPAGEYRRRCDGSCLPASTWCRGGRMRRRATRCRNGMRTPVSVETEVAASDADLVQPVLVEARHVPNQHPSGLHDWNYANLLCLNAYTSKYSIRGRNDRGDEAVHHQRKGQSEVTGKFERGSGRIVLRAGSRRPAAAD